MMRDPPSLFRLVFVSVALPAVFVAVDDAALRYGSAHNWSPVTGVAVSSLFVVQTALLSYVAGAQLTNWGWRLLLLGWSLVLVNLLLATGATVNTWDQRLLSLAFLSAEFGTLVVWLALGCESFLSRIGLVVLAGLPVSRSLIAVGLIVAALASLDPLFAGCGPGLGIVLMAAAMLFCYVAVSVLVAPQIAHQGGHPEPRSWRCFAPLCRPQFSLKTLLWLTVVVGAFFAGAARERNLRLTSVGHWLQQTTALSDRNQKLQIENATLRRDD